MNFAALSGTEIAQRLLLPIQLPAWLCGLPVSKDQSEVLWAVLLPVPGIQC